ncbi:unnamed protein product [Sympodiomycopsis kandeliae]
MMAGLGIDFGSPNEPNQAPLPIDYQRQRAHSHQGGRHHPHHNTHHQQKPKQSNRRPNPGHSHPKRPSTAGGRLPSPQRRVRIASGQPGVLGHGAGHTTDEDLFSSPETNGSNTGAHGHASFGQSLQQSLIDPRVNPRTAVLRSSMSSGYQTSSSSGAGDGHISSSPSDSIFDSGSDFNSPSTQTSATSYGSSAAAAAAAAKKLPSDQGLQRSFTLRKLASQPNLSRTTTIRQPPQPTQQQQQQQPPSEKTICRSQSSNSLNGKNSESGTTLGRSSEIRNTRGPSLRGAPARGAASLRGRGNGRAVSNSVRPEHNKTQSWDGGPIPVLQGQGAKLAPSAAQMESPAPIPNEDGMIPDGFGGYKYPEPSQLPPESEQPQRPSPIEESSPEFPAERSQPPLRARNVVSDADSEHTQEAPVEFPQQYQDTPPLQVTNRGGRSDSVVSGASHASHASSGYTGGMNPQQALRVGSFYGADGVEAARLDASGRLSRAAMNQRQADVRRSVDVRSGPQLSSPPKMRPRSLSAAPNAAHMSFPGNQQQHNETRRSETREQNQGSSDKQGPNVVRMRSVRGFKGLEGAERGESMVAFDQPDADGGHFADGQAIIPGGHGLSDQASVLDSDEQGQQQWPDSTQRIQRNPLVEELSGNKLPDGKRLSHSQSAGHLRPDLHGRNDSMASMTSNGSLAQLERNGTLLNPSANPARRSRDLHRLLGNSSRKVISSSASESERSRSNSPVKNGSNGLQRTNTMMSAMTDSSAVLEKGRSNKARVDIDLLLESDLVVEGGMLRGRLELQIRKPSDGEGAILMAHPKVRVVGFEELMGDDTRHIFYHHATIVDGDRHPGGSQPFVLHGSPTLSSPEAEGRAPLACFASQADHEGYSVGREGSHSIPFSLEMPIGKGAKGSYRGKNGLVRYIVIGSVKLKNAQGGNRSIAHFYRHIDLFPYLNPAVALSSAPRAIQASAEKGLFMGGSGKLRISASLHRGTWVAGQRAYVNVSVDNQTSKRVKNACFTLIRTVTLYRPKPEFDMGSGGTDGYTDPDACSTNTSRKKVTEEVLEMGQKGSKSVVTARGWWTGVEAGTKLDFSHHLTIPSDALSISRGRHVEVAYAIRVSVGGTMSSDVSVEVPLRIISFLSLDPPPLKGVGGKSSALSRGWSGPISNTRSPKSSDEAIAAVKSADALRSPGRVEIGRGQPNVPSGPPNHLLQLQQRAAQRNSLQPPEDPSRKVHHQKSLDFINHAIRSATARRNSNQKPEEDAPMGLGIDVKDRSEGDLDGEQDDEEATPTGSTVSSFATSSEHGYGSSASSARSNRRSASNERVHPSCMPYEHIDVPAPSFGFPFVQLPAVSVDDAGDDFDEEDANRTLGLNDDSVDELDLVVGSTHLEGEGSPGFRQLPITGESDETFDPDCSQQTITTDGYEEDDDDVVTAQVLRSQVNDEDDEPGPELSEPSPNGVRPAVVVASATPEREKAKSAPRPSGVRTSAKAAPRPSVITAKPSSEALKREESNPSLRQRGSNASLRSATSASPGKSNFAPRQLSPSKEAPSPTKPALKSKSSFTFATSDAPIRRSMAPTQETAKEGTRAKADETQFVNSASPSRAQSPRKSTRPLPKEPTVISVPSPRKSPQKLRSDQASDSSSPASLMEALTPESARGDFGPAGEDVQVVEDSAFGPPGGLGLVLEEESGKTKPLATNLNKRLPPTTSFQTPPRARREASVEPAPVAKTESPAAKTIRHSNSTASLTGDRLQRSHSNHNIRGANIIVPSVRSKIAALENRNQALKDFTRPASGSFSKDNVNSPVTTPTRGSQSGTPTKGAQPASPRLARKMSALSLSSEASGATSSTAHQWMRRDSVASNVSFKAPMLKKPA